MKHTITEQISIFPLSSDFLVCPPHKAVYQYERYHTDQSPQKIIAAISAYNNKFSYTIGESVDVAPYVYVTHCARMNNVIVSKIHTPKGR